MRSRGQSGIRVHAAADRRSAPDPRQLADRGSRAGLVPAHRNRHGQRGISFDTAVPRGCLISIFSTNLARTPASASSVPLAAQLDNTTVLVGDLELPAPLYFVSPDQINAQLLSRLWAPRSPSAALAFEFSSSPEIRYDLAACHTNSGGPVAVPFPGDILPLSRIAPQEIQALNALPLPNFDVPATATGLVRVQD
jgi:hypothetical protein